MLKSSWGRGKAPLELGYFSAPEKSIKKKDNAPGKISSAYLLHYVYMKKTLFVLLCALGFCACGSYARTDVRLPDGFVIHARVADTPQKTEKGLMFVKHLPDNKGMLFVFEQEQDLHFWMKNTLIDLDIIFLDRQGKITSISEHMPHTYTYTPDHEVPFAHGYGQYVLEAAAGTAQKHKLKPGDILTWELAQ